MVQGGGWLVALERAGHRLEIHPHSDSEEIMKVKVYLAGPIHGRTDAQAMDWRQWITARLSPTHFEVLDPMRRDYRGREGDNAGAIVQGDLLDIASADVVVVNAEAPSWGTAMEIVYAYGWRKWIIAYGSKLTSPWLVWHTCDRVDSAYDVLDLLYRSMEAK